MAQGYIAPCSRAAVHIVCTPLHGCTANLATCAQLSNLSDKPF
jgi:hypothetical protein